MAVTDSTITSATKTEIRDFLRSNLTDKRSSRTATNWVFTAFPDREVQYPILVISQVGMRDSWMAIGTVKKVVKITLQFSIFAKNEIEPDQIWDELYDDLIDNYKTTSVVDLNLHGLDLLSCNDGFGFVPKAKGNVHMKVGTIQFTYYKDG